MQRQWLGVALGLLLVACSDNGDNGGSGAAGQTSGGSSTAGNTAGGASGSSASGAGGASAGAGGSAGNNSTSGTGGGGSAQGGSGGGSSDAPRGAVSINIPATNGCSLPAHYEEMPLTESGHAVTATEKGPGIADEGEQSDGSPATVSCRWLGDAAPYTATATITTGVGVDRRSISFRTPTEVGVATAATSLVVLPGDKQYMASCMITPIEADDTAKSVWGSFVCATLTPPSGQDTCAIDTSYFYFENCE